MLPADDSRPFDHLGGELPESVVAGFRDQNQIDFDIAFFDQILLRGPDYVDVLRCQGELLTRKGLHERALEIDHRLSKLLPFDPVVHYNLACSLALVGERREAIAALRKALDRGYTDWDYLITDTDLESLRKEPEYLALLQEHGRRDPA